ncbi:MAG: 5-oxoprolinase subunit PxpA [Candidatus Pelagadaptatus aseana]|uniref:5-oxoprolinase subunit PxpA n=1 Tax=Candidatus Pelagadaptatus aseana TaxID=3120508 RepID=UPI0039B296B8
MALLLNCDLGESYGSWTMGMDQAVMPHIDQANIACGFHAGDAMVMNKTLQLAKAHNVVIGAHPSYPDLNGFGRRSMALSASEIHALMTYQIAALDGMALSQGMSLDYVKPHGALYNDMMKQADTRHAIMEAIAAYHRPLKLMLQATAAAETHQQEADQRAIELYFEAFADRCYDDDGALLSRAKPGAVHTKEKMLEQVQQLNEEGTVTTVSGHKLPLQVDTLCVHGDNMEGVQAIETIKQLVSA